MKIVSFYTLFLVSVWEQPLAAQPRVVFLIYIANERQEAEPPDSAPSETARVKRL